MNEYKITYDDIFNGILQSKTTYIIDEDVTLAESRFQDLHARNHYFPPTNVQITLHRENVSASMDEESNAIQSIIAILNSLGLESHVYAAFRGCTDLAGENIKNGKYDSYLDKLDEANAEIDRLRKHAQDVIAESNNIQEALSARIDQLTKQNDKRLQCLENSFISIEDIESLDERISSVISDITSVISTLSQQIVNLADNPDSDEFIVTVKGHRKFKATFFKCESILASLHAMKDKMREANYL